MKSFTMKALKRLHRTSTYRKNVQNCNFVDKELSLNILDLLFKIFDFYCKKPAKNAKMALNRQSISL